MNTPTPADYHALSADARALMLAILSGDHDGAHPVVATAAEREAVDSGCIVTDGAHLWVAQEVCHLVPGHTPTDARAAVTWMFWDWKESPTLEDLREALEPLGVFVHADPLLEGSDTIGFVFSKLARLTPERLENLSRGYHGADR